MHSQGRMWRLKAYSNKTSAAISGKQSSATALNVQTQAIRPALVQKKADFNRLEKLALGFSY